MLTVMLLKNLIRKYTYQDAWDYTNQTEWASGRDVLRTHVDHCIETLRVALMCFADTTPVLIYIEPRLPAGIAGDFETLHTCRKFDDLKAWAADRAVTEY